MADGYASPLGVTVLRRRAIPPLPPEYMGRLVVFGVPASMEEGHTCAEPSLGGAARL